ncbi:MAG: hypothetical protein NT020_13230 [Chloroflexales bacterium]|nr:hypothetical protein [Chloroflexales bacterium]
MPVISSISAGQANLIYPIVEQSNYVHIVPTDSEDVAAYRILDVTPYLGGDVVALSADSVNANRFRLSMISTDTSTPTLRSDTLITNANVKRVVSSNNSILTMANNGQASQLQAFVVTDRRLATRLCDQAGNCTMQAPRSRNTLRLSRTAPAQGSVQIINVTNAYTTTTQSLTFHAEAPSGVQTIQMKIDANAPQTVWTAPIGDPLAAVESATTLTGLTQKSHTVQGINNFNNLLTVKTQYYAPITQATLPITDVLHTVGSDRCTAGNTAPGITCPAIVSGATGNAIQLSRATDGIRMGYAITQTTVMTQSVSMRIKIPSNGVSGRIATIAPLTGSAPALKLWFDYDSGGNQVNTSLLDTSGITLTSTMTIPDTAWHLLTVVSGVVTDANTLMIYLDGALVDSITGQGRFANVALILGATPVNGAATNVVLDDIAVFSDALTSDNLQDMLAGDDRRKLR